MTPTSFNDPESHDRLLTEYSYMDQLRAIRRKQFWTVVKVLAGWAVAVVALGYHFLTR